MSHLGVALYRTHFVDHGDNVYATEYVEEEDDHSAIAAADRINVINVPTIGTGFDLWEDTRLVHRHRN